MDLGGEESELVIALTEVEKVINCCPTESSDPDGGFPISLCPEQFLLPPRKKKENKPSLMNFDREESSFPHE